MFSASTTYIEKLKSIENIETYMNKEAFKFMANEEGIFKGLKVRDKESGAETIIEGEGAFIFIGLIPNTQVFKDFIDLNAQGFITTSGLANTSVKGVFAARACR